MALVTRAASASVDMGTAMHAQRISGVIAGEDIDACAPCYIKASDGKAYMSNGTANDEAACCWGFCPRHAHAGEPVTLFGPGLRMSYGSSLTVGAKFYVAATAGRLDTAATTGGLTPVARVLPGGADIIVTATFA